MQETIRVLMGDYGNLAVFFLIMIENLFPPIPSEVILTFGGFMTTCSEMTAPGVILSATAGSLMGAVLLYLVGYLIPEEKLMQTAALVGHTGEITAITAHNDNLLEFTLKDGTNAVKRWQNRSRAESWTAEMRRAAGEKTRERKQHHAES